MVFEWIYVDLFANGNVYLSSYEYGQRAFNLLPRLKDLNRYIQQFRFECKSQRYSAKWTINIAPKNKFRFSLYFTIEIQLHQSYETLQLAIFIIVLYI